MTNRSQRVAIESGVVNLRVHLCTRNVVCHLLSKYGFRNMSGGEQIAFMLRLDKYVCEWLTIVFMSMSFVDAGACAQTNHVCLFATVFLLGSPLVFAPRGVVVVAYL